MSVVATISSFARAAMNILHVTRLVLQSDGSYAASLVLPQFFCLLWGLPQYSKALMNLYHAGTSSDELPFLQLVMDRPNDSHRMIEIVLR